MGTARHQPETCTLLTMTCHLYQFYVPRIPTPIASLHSDHFLFLECIDPQHLPPTTPAPLTEKYSHLHLTTESHHNKLLLNHFSLYQSPSCASRVASRYFTTPWVQPKTNHTVHGHHSPTSEVRLNAPIRSRRIMLENLMDSAFQYTRILLQKNTDNP